MPILKLIFCCCVGWALYGQEEQPKPQNESKTVEDQPAKPPESKSKKTVKKVASDKPPEPTPALAAQKILDALAVAIQTLPKEAQPALIGKPAELRARLNPAGDPTEIAKEAVELLATLYVPANKAPPPEPPRQAPQREASRQYDY